MDVFSPMILKLISTLHVAESVSRASGEHHAGCETTCRASWCYPGMHLSFFRAAVITASHPLPFMETLCRGLDGDETAGGQWAKKKSKKLVGEGLVKERPPPPFQEKTSSKAAVTTSSSSFSVHFPFKVSERSSHTLGSSLVEHFKRLLWLKGS